MFSSCHLLISAAFVYGVTAVCLEAQCNNGQCISLTQECDGTVDCSDGSDEGNCSCTDFPPGLDPNMVCVPGTCPRFQYLSCTCRSGYQLTISVGGVCKPAVCHYHRQWTSTGMPCACVPVPGMSTTSTTTRSSPPVSSKLTCPGQFYCWKSNKCIPRIKRCDGSNDCGNSEDELYCLGFKCLDCICGASSNNLQPGCGNVTGDKKCGPGCQQYRGDRNCGCGIYLLKEDIQYARCLGHEPNNTCLQKYADFKSCAADQTCAEICIGILFQYEMPDCASLLSKSVSDLNCLHYARVFWSGAEGCQMAKARAFAQLVAQCLGRNDSVDD